MPVGSEHASWWMTSTHRTAYPSLSDGDADVDVAVLGGGIAGLTTAYALAREGRRDVLVVEAGRIVEGVTGYTTAKVSVAHNLVYADLVDRFDAATARGYAESQSAALHWVREAVQRERIDCELETVPSLVYTESSDERSSIESEVAAARACGLAAELVTDSPLPYPISAGVRLADQAQFHPRKYLLALAERFVAAGGRIAEGTRALDVTPGEPCVVETDHGQVRAREVVVATHYPFLDRGLLFSRLAPYRDLVVAAAVDADRDPGVIAISTGAEPGGTHSVRTAPLDEGRRLLVVTGGQYKTGTTSDVQTQYEHLAEWVRDRFPGAEVTHHWSTQDTSSVDRLPYVGRLPNSGDHVWVATGFSAWGMTGGTLAGTLLTDLLQGRASRWAEMYDPGRADLGPSVKEVVKENLGVAKELVKGVATAEVGSPDALALGQAGVFLGRHGRTAAFRDESGLVHAVSARCTHLGCTVRFNNAERSWDCPCHGSRFALDGSVLQGPAVEPLEPRTD